MSYPITSPEAWPVLDWREWQDTADTLHMLMQIVGKTKTILTPVQNHWWNVTFHLSARGLSTLAMPVPKGGSLDIEFDFIDHELVLRHSAGQVETIKFEPQSVASFFVTYQSKLEALGVEVRIDPLPVELKQPVRFHQDTLHKSYDPEAVSRFWQILSQASILLKRFSTNFYGKISPVHFFWGSLDLAVTRFNGRRAPVRPGADAIQAEAYSHECISAGFWPGNGGYGQAAFYAYAAPVPVGLTEVQINGPGGYNNDLGEFILNYTDVQQSSDPTGMILAFLNDTYAAAANAAGWDRTALDRTDSVAQSAVRV